MKDKLYDFIDRHYLVFYCTFLFAFISSVAVIRATPRAGLILCSLGVAAMCALLFHKTEAFNKSHAKARQRLQDQRDSASSDWDGIVRCADDILPRLRLLLGRMEQDQQEVNDLCELSSRIAEGDQAADSYDWDGIVQCADDIESRLRVLRGRTKQNQQEVNDLRYRYELSSRLAESDQTANS
jgi:hypothetical protein